MPRTSWGRPSIVVGRVEVARGQRVADRGGRRRARSAAGRAPRGRAPSTSKPSSAPIVAQQRDVARRWWPKWKSSPTITSRARRGASTSTSRTKSSAGSFERASSKVITRQRSTPVAASSSSFWSRSVSSRGAVSGRTTAAGWRSKVTTVARGRRRPRPAPDLGDDRLVAEVHAVVGADRDDAAARSGRAAALDVVHDLHRAEVRSGSLGRAQPRAWPCRCGAARRRRGGRRSVDSTAQGPWPDAPSASSGSTLPCPTRGDEVAVDRDRRAGGAARPPASAGGRA